MSKWEVITGDCLEVLRGMESGSVDAVVTSPPYNTLPDKHAPGGLHGERKSGVNKWIAKAAAGYFDQRPEGEYQTWINAIVTECLRVSRGLVWVNHKIRYRDGLALHPVRWMPFPIYAEVVWDRGGSMALNCKRYSPSHEVFIAFGNPTFWNDDLNTLMSVWRIPPQLSTEHPCPYPVELARRPVESSTPVGGTVLDPFCGSGTTGVACVQTGRNFIGIEIDPKYADIARRRIADAVPLFAQTQEPKPEQAEMFRK